MMKTSMGDKEMSLRVRLVLLVCVVAASSAGPANANGATDPRTFNGASIQDLHADTLWRLACDQSTASAYYLAYSLSGPSDSENGFVALGDYNVSVAVHSDETNYAFTLARETAPGPYDMNGSVSGNEATLKVVWASWGDEISCRLIVNGIEVPHKELPRANVAHLSAADFSSGTGAEVGWVSGGINLETRRPVDGSLFAFMTADAGSVGARGPDGDTYEPTQFSRGVPLSSWLGIGKESHGPWVFTASLAVAATMGNAELWIADPPL